MSDFLSPLYSGDERDERDKKEDKSKIRVKIRLRV